jgi:hypothetical protein
VPPAGGDAGQPEAVGVAADDVGSLRPEELREARRKGLDNERKNLQSMLTQVQTTRATLDSSVDKADQLVQKLHVTLEADIDKSLGDGNNDPPPDH